MHEQLDKFTSPPLNELQVGDRVSLFSVAFISDDEVILEDNDKHLRVQISVQRDTSANKVTLSSVVHVHNWVGRFYMFFVGPAHRLIVPVMILGIP